MDHLPDNSGVTNIPETEYCTNIEGKNMEVETISIYSGNKLLYFEHNYCQNATSLFEMYNEDRSESDPDKIFKSETTSQTIETESDIDINVSEPRQKSEKELMKYSSVQGTSFENVSEDDELDSSTVLDDRNLVENAKVNITESAVADDKCGTPTHFKRKLSKNECKIDKDVSIKKKILQHYEKEQSTVLSKDLAKDEMIETNAVSLNQEKVLKQKVLRGNKRRPNKKLEIKFEPKVIGENRKKRVYSEPSRFTSVLNKKDITDLVAKRKLRNMTKVTRQNKKKIEKTVTENRHHQRKRSISASSEKEEMYRSDEKSNGNMNKGKRKKCSSLSESIAMAIGKKELSTEKIPEFKGPSFPCNVVKSVKQKKSGRRESSRTIMSEDEPPLFSQPDVLVKVKSDDLSPKKDEKLHSENKNHDKKHTSQATNNQFELDQNKSFDLNLKQTEVVPKFIDELKIEERDKESLSAYSYNENFIDDFNTKDIDSENSLQIDESVGGNDSKEIDEKIIDTISENPTILSTVSSKHNIDTCDSQNSESLTVPHDSLNKKELKDDESSIIQTTTDLDSDKPIAERKPRRIIKKKEFFEDIASRSEIQTKKTGGKPRSVDKKSEDNKQGRKNSTQKEDESDSDESEDDPEKLWCICRKPHNDRFMIQCDSCEDWFHGSCVGVTRLQGRKLEKQKKEWKCPNCLSKAIKSLNMKSEKVPEKDTETIEKKMKVDENKKIELEKDAFNKSSTTIIKTENTSAKIPIKNFEPEVLSTISSSSKVGQTSSKKSPSKIIRSSVKETVIGSNNKKVVKEAVKKKLNCIVCQAPSIANSSYCSEKCIEKHAASCLSIMRDAKGALKGPEFELQKVVVLDCLKGNIIAGDNAPTAGEIVSWLKKYPSYMIACASSVVSNSKKECTQKKDIDPATTSKEKKESPDESSKTVVRLNVRKTLKNILVDRCKNADDMRIPEDDVRKIAVKIEEELSSLFKDNSFKYRAKYRSLMFNIKDPRNQGLFRKILNGTIPPDKLVRMSPEELASLELAKWREQENQHLLDMIKRVQLEQQSGSVHMKKTHKGDVEIEDDFTSIIEQDLPKAPSKFFSDEGNESDRTELDKVIVKDTTHLHRSHLFDLNCKICTGKIIPPPVEEIAQKRVRVAHSISVDQSSSTLADTDYKTTSKSADMRSPLSSNEEDSLDQEPTSTVSIGSPETSLFTSDKEYSKAATSVWKGFIYMQDVAKFVTSAYKVSGQTDQLHVNVPDTIQVCGRIIPDQVFDYLGKIKQSGNKELIVIRFQAANDEEAVTYHLFYSYLSSRRRYGVVSNYSKKIKDFYILPLAATSPVPIVLMPFDGPGLPSPRPHLLLGVIVRHKAKQPSVSTSSKKEKFKEDLERPDASYTPPLDNRSYTPPLPTLSTDSTVNMTPDSVFSPAIDLKINLSEETSNTQASIVSCDTSKSSSEVYEPSYTPPLEILPVDYEKSEDDKPYDPEQDIQNIESDTIKSKPSPKEIIHSSSDENLEKHKQILDALTRQVEETDRQVNALKQLISQPDDSDAEIHSPSNQSLDINSVTASGMSSFLDLPENLQDILNVVREKSLDKEKPGDKSDVDMRINELFTKSLKNIAKFSHVEEKNVSSKITDEDLSSVMRPSDPRIKIKSALQESCTSGETDNVSLSNMSVSELVQRAEKELADIEAFENVNKMKQISPTTQEQLPNLDKISSWNQFKEPPPPGLEPSDLNSQDSSYSCKTTSSITASDGSLSSSVSSSSLIADSQLIGPHFPPPYTTHLPPNFPIQTPIPNLKNFPPPVLSPSFPPPPLPVVSKANDANPINENWTVWSAPPQHADDNTWKDRIPQWDENRKHATEGNSVDPSESSFHYYPPGTHEFQKEQFYRNDPPSEGIWNRSANRFSRNSWKRPRNSRWRGRRPFHFSKNQRN